MTAEQRFACRSCGHEHPTVVLRMGEMPLANGFLQARELTLTEPRYPLDFALCQRCGLAQITHTVPPDTLFREYLYFSSFSDTIVQHGGELAARMVPWVGLGAHSLVVELGSNDGYLLQHFVRRGVPVLGIEPAGNVADAANARGVPTLNEFFGQELAAALRSEGRQADVIIANNVLAHVADLNGFVAGIGMLLADRGVASIEVPYVNDLLEKREFDTIYHEHLCYFSLSALDALFRRHGLTIERVEHLAVHGGSLRIFVGRRGRFTDGSVSAMIDAEDRGGTTSLERYERFASDVERTRDSLRQLLRRLKAGGTHIAGYGAAAKGTVLLNYCGIGPDLVDFVVDRSPHKQGRFIPGVRIPITAPEDLIVKKPDYTLLLAWNFADEIIGQQSDYRRIGGQFIVPIPDPVIK